MGAKKYDEYGFRITPSKTSPPAPPSAEELATIDERNREKRKQTMSIVFVVGCIITAIVAAFLAGFIAWNCYANDLKWIRRAKTIAAFFFSFPYLAYFFILRFVLQVPCF